MATPEEDWGEITLRAEGEEGQDEEEEGLRRYFLLSFAYISCPFLSHTSFGAEKRRSGMGYGKS